MELKTFFVVLHIFGVAIGAGAAFMSDALFFASIKDRKITGDEMRGLRITSRAVWLGLALLIISGAGIFASNPEFYMAASKFLAKMTVVGIIIVNGLLFHAIHLRNFEKSIGKDFFRSLESDRSGHFVYLSGVISVVSWVAAIILGSLRNLSLSYPAIIFFYFFAISIGAVGALIVMNPVIDKPEKKSLFWGGIVLPLILMTFLIPAI